MSDNTFEPKIIKIDPRLIRFNKENHREHKGAKLARLQENIEGVGLVQLPSVRVIANNVYECLDGEGRIRSFIAANKPYIYVVSFGHISDDKALAMLESANIVRNYHPLDVCKGLAKLRASGISTRDIREQYLERDINKGALDDMIAIGMFPGDILKLIEDDIASDTKRESVWTIRLLREVLPLRIEIAREEKSRGKNGPARKITYDYSEVKVAIEMVINREISNSIRMESYAIARRNELLEERIETIVHDRLEKEKESALEEITQAKQNAFALKEKNYQDKLAELEARYADLDRKHKLLAANATKRPEIIQRHEEDLKLEINKTTQAREEFLKAKREVEENAQKAVDQLLQSEKIKLNEERESQRIALEQQYKQLEESLRRDFDLQLESIEKRDQERQLKLENTVRQAILHNSSLITQIQKSLVLLFTTDYKKHLQLMTMPELSALYSQLDALGVLIDHSKRDLRTLAEQDHVITIENAQVHTQESEENIHA